MPFIISEVTDGGKVTDGGLIFTFDIAGRSVKLCGYGEALASGI